MNRCIDELGRIVIPKEIRNKLNVQPGDNLNISIENNNIVLSKSETLEELIAQRDSLNERIKNLENKNKN